MWSISNDCFCLSKKHRALFFNFHINHNHDYEVTFMYSSFIFIYWWWMRTPNPKEHIISTNQKVQCSLSNCINNRYMYTFIIIKHQSQIRICKISFFSVSMKTYMISLTNHLQILILWLQKHLIKFYIKKKPYFSKAVLSSSKNRIGNS